MKKMINSEKIEGRIYQHNLTIKQVQNKDSKNFGKDFISGEIEIATNESCTNVIPVHFTYVTETTASGNTNRTYSTLKKIIDEGKTYINDGDEATCVKVDTSIALNDFYMEDRLVSQKRNEGGFVTIINKKDLSEDENERNTFTADMLVTNVIRVEADPEKNIEKDYLTVKGCVFNFRNDLLPIDFIIRNEKGIEYFEDLEISPNEPVFTKVWGKINSCTVKTEIKEESAFGEESVRVVERKTKEWVITGTAKAPYDFGEEGVLTSEEVKTAIQNRELMLADTKKRSDDYKNSKNTQSTQVEKAPVTAAVTKDSFNF